MRVRPPASRRLIALLAAIGFASCAPLVLSGCDDGGTGTTMNDTGLQDSAQGDADEDTSTGSDTEPGDTSTGDDTAAADTTSGDTTTGDTTTGDTTTGDTTTGDTTTGDTTTGDTTTGDTTTGDAQDMADTTLPPSPCPETLPADSASCDRNGLVCEYGDDPRRECHDYATCTDGSWVVEEAKCDPLPSADCPPTRGDANGMMCDVDGAVCEYDDGLTCTCTNCVEHPVPTCGGPLTWDCDEPNLMADCPASYPRLGDSCGGPGGAAECTDGVWTEADGTPCPISSREFKTDIDYLDTSEVDAVAQRALSMPLATWRYTDPVMAERERLGIIIEDVGDVPAVDARRRMVDLYGYSAMLHATVQSQARAIEALRADVEALRDELKSARQQASVCEER